MTASPPPVRRFRLRRGSLDIQSKLLIMLLVVSVLATIVVGVVGYLSGRSSLQDAAISQVTSLRESRAREIERTVADVEREVILNSRGDSAVEGLRAFSAAFDELQSAPILADQKAAVDTWYEQEFLPTLEERTGTRSDPQIFQPTTSAQTYLQYHYTIPFDDFDAAIQTDDAGDGSSWSAVHAQYHDYFREVVLQADYEDLLLLDVDGNVIYSAYAGVDLGTNVRTGPFSTSALTTAYEGALRLNTIDSAVVTDFDRYQPSLGVPTAWVATPVGADGEVFGALALQVPTSSLNDVMTGNEQWVVDGLGETGEAYIAGPDELMRSPSRLLLEDPEQFEERVVAAGTDPDLAARQVAVNGNVLLQPVRTEPVARALTGDSGTIITTDYLGQESITAYAPLDIPGLQWVIVAKIDTAEAFAPVDAFTRTLLLSMAGIVVLVCLLSLVLAQVFVRPLRRMQQAVNRVSAGELGVEVPTTSGDEFGELGAAFNDMSRSLELKQNLIDEQRTENERLLHTLMPEAVAKRYRQGEETIADDHQDVSVAFADIVGFGEYSRGMPSGEALSTLNGIWRSFDEAAERTGVERVRSSRSGYLASCGLTVPRVDNAQRIVEFTREAHAAVERFNAQYGASLALRAGIDTGTVTSGLVGRSSVVYDMWGDAVSLAFSVQGASSAAGIFATQRVVDRLGEDIELVDAGTVDTQSGPQRVWKLEVAGTRV